MRRFILSLFLLLSLTGCRLQSAPVFASAPAAADVEPQVADSAGNPVAGPTLLAEMVVQQTAAAYAGHQGDAVTVSGAWPDAAPNRDALSTPMGWVPSDQDAAIDSPAAQANCSPGAARFNALLIRNRIILDGDVDAWYASFHEASNVVAGAEKWAGDWDLSAGFQTGWTEQAFYVVVRVTDERYVQAADEADDVYLGDSIDLLVDADLCGDLDSTTMNSDDFHLRISPGYLSTAGDRSVYRMQPSPAGAISQATVVSSRVGNVTNYEIEIPWEVLGVKNPVPGQMVRFALLVNDNDDPLKNLQESVLATTIKTLEDSLDPHDWALLVLRE